MSKENPITDRLPEYELHKLSFLKAVLHQVEELQDELEDEEDTTVYIERENLLLAGFFNYFELNRDFGADLYKGKS